MSKGRDSDTSSTSNWHPRLPQIVTLLLQNATAARDEPLLILLPSTITFICLHNIQNILVVRTKHLTSYAYKERYYPYIACY